jgi:choline dehydrogenase-like flavoprotein
VERYDVVVIGTGAGGGTLLWRLASLGKRILVLERGDFLPRERENWDPLAVARGRYQARDTWIDRNGAPFRPYTHYWVGGNTKVYGAALLRLRPSDFQELRHWGGISPAWPLDYGAFEPYYEQAERLYHVHGEADADPTEPPRSGPYPHPPVPMEPRMKEIAACFRSMGLRPFSCPLGVRLAEDEPVPSAPRVLGLFDGYPDPTGTKADAESICVEPALRQPRVTLLVNSWAERLETDASGGRVERVVVRRDGKREEYAADLVVVACGAIQSAALLLRSASDRHPHGLANGSGLVGRNYMCHNNGMLIAVSDLPNPSRFQKAFALADFYHGGGDSSFPLGLIQLMGKPDPELLESLVRAHLPDVPSDELGRHTVDFFLTAEDLPDPTNRVTVEEDGRIRVSYRENNREAYDRLRDRLAACLDAMASDAVRPVKHRAYVGPKLGVSGVSHQAGTLRFGADPRASVLDLDCRAHELDNLYVVDASFFPSVGAVNPSLTIMANALRVGDQLEDQLTS